MRSECRGEKKRPEDGRQLEIGLAKVCELQVKSLFEERDSQHDAEALARTAAA